MPIQLYKLVLSGTTNATPTVNRYFYKPAADISVSSAAPYTITSTEFQDDSGNAVTGNLTIKTSNGYYMLNIDGVLQQTSLFTVLGSGSGVQLLADATAPYSILTSIPVTLAVTNFSATTTVTN